MRILKFFLIPLMFFCFALFSKAQSPNDLIDESNINLKFLEHLVKLEIDSVRQSKRLNALLNDSILYLAASDQVNYLDEKRKLSHFQPENKEKKSPQNRIEFYGGKYYITGENAILIYINTPTTYKHEKKKGINTTHVISTYKQAALDIMIGWVNSPGHYANIVTKEYKITGVALSFDSKENVIRGVQVFGGVDDTYSYKENSTMFPYAGKASYEDIYYKPKKNIPKKHKKHAWNLKAADNSEDCQNCKYAGLYWFNCKIALEKDSIFIYFKDPSLISRLVVDNKDGFALEFVNFKHMYSCDLQDNKVIPSRENGLCIFNGKVSVPVYSKDILDKIDVKKIQTKKGKSKEKWTKIFLCKTPQTLLDEKNEINILIIKDRKVCDIIPTQQICGQLWSPKGETLKYMYNAYDENSTGKYKPVVKTLNKTFIAVFEKNKYYFDESSLMPLFDTIREFNYEVINAEVDAYASVEGTHERNEQLFNSRASELISTLEKNQDTVISLKVVAKENWEKMMKQIKGTEYEFLKDKDTTEIRKYVNEHSDEMEPILAEQRYAYLKLTLRTKVNENNIDEIALADYQKIISSKDKMGKDICLPCFKKAEIIQLFLYDRYPGSPKKDLIDANLTVPDDPRLYNLQFNKVMFDYMFAQNKISDDSLWFWLKKMYDQKTNDAKINYNYKAFLFNNRENEEYAKFLSQDFISDLLSKSETLKADSNNIKNLMLLFHFSKASDAYNKTPDKLKNIEGSLEYIYKYYENREENDETFLSLAKFFVMFDKFNYSLYYLDKMINREEPNHIAITFYLKIKYILSDKNDRNEILQMIIDSEEILTDTEWCNMFIGPCNINTQIFSNETLRRMYCEKCREKNQ
ncbi:MAG: CAP domain-containing protein [Bacteroidales bacterium]|nr:CAP domain-containing protein [Bacteroidales bacterium]